MQEEGEKERPWPTIWLPRSNARRWQLEQETQDAASHITCGYSVNNMTSLEGGPAGMQAGENTGAGPPSSCPLEKMRPKA